MNQNVADIESRFIKIASRPTTLLKKKYFDQKFYGIKQWYQIFVKYHVANEYYLMKLESKHLKYMNIDSKYHHSILSFIKSIMFK